MTQPDTPRTGIPINGRVIFRAGIALVLVGMLFLFRYSIEQGWFGPTARVTLGAVFSAALVATGLLVGRPAYGRLLQGAGIGGGYITAWAAHGLYDLVDETTAFVQMVLVAAAGIGLAWRERSDILSALGLVGAVAAPLLVGGEFVAPAGEVAYQVVALAIAGLLFVSRGWWITLAVTSTGSGLVLAAGALGSDPAPVLLVGIAAWWLVSWGLPVLGRQLGLVDLDAEIATVATIPVPLAAWVMAWVMVDGSPAVGSALATMGAIVHGTVWLRERRAPHSAVDLLVGIVFTILAVGIRLEAEVAVPVYLAIALAVAVYGSRVADRIALVVGTAAAAFAVPVWLIIVDQAGSSTVATAVTDLASVLIVAAAAFLITDRAVRVGTATTAYTMALVWIARHLGGIDPGWATAGFAVLGLIALVGGRLQRSRLLTGVGLATLAMAVGKLILVDLASADPLLKIGLAFGIGIALLAVGYWVGDAALLTEDEPDSDVEPLTG